MSPLTAAPGEFISYSANLEDVLLRRVFAGTEAGFYVDVGAAHPEFESDTKALRDRGWRGINVEPNAGFLRELIAQRPDDTNLGVALSDRPGEGAYFEVLGTGLSTLDAANAERASAKGRAMETHRVTVSTLARILEEAGAPAEFELLKVDVEGSERAVLAGNDWTRFRPRLVLVEATVPESPQRADNGVGELMRSVGWRHAWFDGLNDWYLAPGFEPPRGAFDAPPNVFDRYVARRTAAAEAEAAWLRDTVADREHSLQAAQAEAEASRAAQAKIDETLRTLDVDLARLRLEAAARTAAVRALTDALLQAAPMAAGHFSLPKLAARLSGPPMPSGDETMADAECSLAAVRLLQADNARLRLAIADMEPDLERQRRALAELQEALMVSRREVATIHAALAEQKSLLAERARQAEEAGREVAALRSSTSWRVSRPVRAFGRLLGRGG